MEYQKINEAIKKALAGDGTTVTQTREEDYEEITILDVGLPGGVMAKIVREEDSYGSESLLSLEFVTAKEKTVMVYE